jgi:hypothetical protein
VRAPYLSLQRIAPRSATLLIETGAELLIGPITLACEDDVTLACNKGCYLSLRRERCYLSLRCLPDEGKGVTVACGGVLAF